MRIAGSEYLIQLSLVSVPSVGFGAVVVTLRQALGARLSDLHLHFVRLFIEGGLAVAAFGYTDDARSRERRFVSPVVSGGMPCRD